jgi:hypothetical protein
MKRSRELVPVLLLAAIGALALGAAHTRTQKAVIEVDYTIVQANGGPTVNYNSLDGEELLPGGALVFVNMNAPNDPFEDICINILDNSNNQPTDLPFGKPPITIAKKPGRIKTLPNVLSMVPSMSVTLDFVRKDGTPIHHVMVAHKAIPFDGPSVVVDGEGGFNPVRARKPLPTHKH